MQHLQPNTTLQGGKYRIERELGQGGYSIRNQRYMRQFADDYPDFPFVQVALAQLQVFRTTIPPFRTRWRDIF